MRAYVFGSTGMLGRYVAALYRERGFDVREINRSKRFDARNSDHVRRVARKLGSHCEQPFVVVNCMGAIKQKHADPETLFAVNGVFPLVLAEVLGEYEDARMIHISSDCVFSGRSRKPYHEHDPRDATDFYGQSKAIGEDCFKYPHCKILRTSIVGEDPRSSASLLEWVRAQEGDVPGYINHVWNGVTCLQVAKACVSLTHNYHRQARRLYNLTSPQPITKFDLVNAIVDCYDLKVNVTATQAKDDIWRVLQRSRQIECFDYEDFFSEIDQPFERQLKEQRAFSAKILQ